MLAAATAMLRDLKRKRAVPYDDLKSTLQRRSESAEFLFTPAVSLLYVLGLLEYRAKVDAFEYTGQ
ncbi:ABC-three component system middle component 8 [Geodermatophilus sp. URMC 60]